MKVGRAVAIALALIGVAAGGYVYYPSTASAPQQTANGVAPAPGAPVVVADAAARPFNVDLNVIGTAQAYSTVAVKSPLPQPRSRTLEPAVMGVDARKASSYTRW